MAKRGTSVVKSAGSGTQPDLQQVRLADRYDLEKDQVFITGTQAVVRLMLMQKERDRRAGCGAQWMVRCCAVRDLGQGNLD